MKRTSALLLAIIAGAGAWFFFQNYQISGIDNLVVVPRSAVQSAAKRSLGDPLGGVPPMARKNDTIKIASFKIAALDETKADKPEVMSRLAHIIRQFDVVAIQGIRSKDESLIPTFVEQINAPGRHYDYMLGPRVGRTSPKQQFAYIFDTASLQVDRAQTYTVQDPLDVLHAEPLVAWFRVRGPDPNQAFTFTLINVHVDPNAVAAEMDVMDDVFRAVRDDPRGEDDVILLGGFNAGESQIGQLASIPGITWVLSGTTTNTRGTNLYDNIFMQRHATSEYTGRSGVYDFLRQYNLTLAEGLEISDHLPIWAEFSIYEGGTPGPFAALPSEQR